MFVREDSVIVVDRVGLFIGKMVILYLVRIVDTNRPARASFPADKLIDVVQPGTKHDQGGG